MNNTNEVLGKMAGLVTTYIKAISMLGARAMVMGKFLEAALPQLTTSQRTEVARSFRQGTEKVLSSMDDVSCPPNITRHYLSSPMPSSLIWTRDQPPVNRAWFHTPVHRQSSHLPVNMPVE